MNTLAARAQAPASPRLKIALATAFVILCWGYSPTGIRQGLQAYDPFHLALLRFLLASAFMAVIALAKGIALPRWRDVPLLVALGFFAVTLHHVAINAGQQGVSAAASSVLAQSTPLFSALLAHFVFGQRVSAWRWACVGLGLAGALIVVSGGQRLAEVNAYGLLVLLAALSWAVYFALQQRHAQRYSGLTMVCYTVWFGTALLLVFLPGLAAQVAQAPARANLAVLVLGLGPSSLAYLAWAYVLARVEVSRASISLYLTPLAAIAIAQWLLGERPGLAVLIGAAVILASVAALNLGGRR
ncbi:EamA family transporter [Pseudomonas sp. NPDC007930]|uniref:DMT family transporter n=1 Tax=Pseudomonas sp. NPDC007930 TaxID=3364417 RepID=UPI0036E61AA4